MKKYLIVSMLAFVAVFMFGGHKALADRNGSAGECAKYQNDTNDLIRTHNLSNPSDLEGYITCSFGAPSLNGESCHCSDASPTRPTGPTGKVSSVINKNIGVVLSTGSKGTDVSNIQTLLNKKGFNCGKADGVFGKNTFTALSNFQKANKLTVTGKADSITFGLLNK